MKCDMCREWKECYEYTHSLFLCCDCIKVAKDKVDRKEL